MVIGFLVFVFIFWLGRLEDYELEFYVFFVIFVMVFGLFWYIRFGRKYDWRVLVVDFVVEFR